MHRYSQDQTNRRSSGLWASRPQAPQAAFAAPLPHRDAARRSTVWCRPLLRLDRSHAASQSSPNASSPCQRLSALQTIPRKLRGQVKIRPGCSPLCLNIIYRNELHEGEAYVSTRHDVHSTSASNHGRSCARYIRLELSIRLPYAKSPELLALVIHHHPVPTSLSPKAPFSRATAIHATPPHKLSRYARDSMCLPDSCRRTSASTKKPLVTQA